MRYCRRVISKQRVKSQGCAISRTRVIRQNLPHKIIEFSMVCHVGVQLKYTNMAWQHVEFTLAISNTLLSLLSLQTFTSLIILVVQTSCT